jgi:hypothetical protein
VGYPRRLRAFAAMSLLSVASKLKEKNKLKLEENIVEENEEGNQLLAFAELQRRHLTRNELSGIVSIRL